MGSRAEERACRLLREILAALPVGEHVPASDTFRDALAALEWFVSEVVRSDALDGIFPVVARKSGDDEVEIYGPAVLISDQTVTPLHLRLQLAPVGDELSCGECRLGERGLVRMPFDALHTLSKRFRRAADPVGEFDWDLRVTWGRRRVT